MSDHPNVAIFWDYENCSPPSISSGLGYGIVNNVGRIARLFGSVTTFRAYLDVSTQSPKSVALRSELQSSGVSMIDCPHNGKKDVVDKMILVDMLAFAVDRPSPATIILITGDRDYAYAVSTLKLRRYRVILIVPSSFHTSACLESQASLVVDWGTAILKSRTDPENPTQPCSGLDASLVAKLLRELQESPSDDPNVAPHSASRLRRVTPRDLLGPSRHAKSTESLDSTQEFAHDPASPKKSATTGLSIPKTPSRSRHASVSTESSTRARSTTMVAPCLPFVEPCTPAQNLPPFAGSTFDVAGAASHVKPSASVSTSELSLLDNRPPSSIIVRSPLEPARSTACDMPCVSGEAHISSSQTLDCLASPVTRPTESRSHTTIEPTLARVGSTRALAETVTAACRTPQTQDTGVPNPEEIERQTGLHFENQGTCEGSVPHRAHPDGAADLATSNCYDSCVAPRATTQNPESDGNVGSHPADSPAPCAASFPGAGDSDDSARFDTPWCAANVRDYVAPPGSVSAGAPHLVPSDTTEPREHDDDDEYRRCQTWAVFKPLICLLLAAREQGVARPSRSTIAMDLARSDDQVYERAGASRFRDYTALAEKAGVIELGGKEADAWIALHPDWFGVHGSAATQSVSDRVSSATPASPTASSILTGPATPPIERAAIFRTPTPDASSTSTSDRQDCAPRKHIPASFQPLIDALVRLRAEGSHQPRRSIIGQMLNQAVYSRAGASGFKEYILWASVAQLIQLGGSGGHAWIGLHPELRC